MGPDGALTLAGAAGLVHHHRLVPPPCLGERPAELPAVGHPLHEQREHPHAGILQQRADVVAQVEIRLVADGHEAADADPPFPEPAHEGAPEGATLGEVGDLAAGRRRHHQGPAEGPIEAGVGIHDAERVGTAHADAGGTRRRDQPPLGLRLPRLCEPGGEHDGRADPPRPARAESGLAGLGGHGDAGHLDVAGQRLDRSHRGHPVE